MKKGDTKEKFLFNFTAPSGGQLRRYRAVQIYNS
jgi:hypothetical protein